MVYLRVESMLYVYSSKVLRSSKFNIAESMAEFDVSWFTESI